MILRLGKLCMLFHWNNREVTVLDSWRVAFVLILTWGPSVMIDNFQLFSVYFFCILASHWSCFWTCLHDFFVGCPCFSMAPYRSPNFQSSSTHQPKHQPQYSPTFSRHPHINQSVNPNIVIFQYQIGKKMSICLFIHQRQSSWCLHVLLVDGHVLLGDGQVFLLETFLICLSENVWNNLEGPSTPNKKKKRNSLMQRHSGNLTCPFWTSIRSVFITVIFLSFQTDRAGQIVRPRSDCSLIRVYTVCNFLCIFWMHF